jgi:hypothetical protein
MNSFKNFIVYALGAAVGTAVFQVITAPAHADATFIIFTAQAMFYFGLLYGIIATGYARYSKPTLWSSIACGAGSFIAMVLGILIVTGFQHAHIPSAEDLPEVIMGMVGLSACLGIGGYAAYTLTNKSGNSPE